MKKKTICSVLFLSATYWEKVNNERSQPVHDVRTTFLWRRFSDLTLFQRHVLVGLPPKNWRNKLDSPTIIFLSSVLSRQYTNPAGKIGGVYFWLYGIAYWMPIQLAALVLLLNDFKLSIFFFLQVFTMVFRKLLVVLLMTLVRLPHISNL